MEGIRCGITLFVLSMVVILSFAVAACHDNNSNNNSRNTFTEDQFADGSRIYTASTGISVLDAASKMLVGVVDLPGENQPSAVAVSPDGSEVYAVKPVDNTLHIIDAQSSQVTGTFTVPNATDVAVLPDGSKL